MTPELWHQIEQHYYALVDLNPQEREPALQRIEDPIVCNQVRAMLNAGPMPLQVREAIQSLALDNVKESPGDQRFGPWRATRLIGFGGMGAVYEGVRDDQAFDKKAAIKILQTGRDSPDSRERFRQERDILAKAAAWFAREKASSGSSGS